MAKVGIFFRKKRNS